MVYDRVTKTGEIVYRHIYGMEDGITYLSDEKTEEQT